MSDAIISTPSRMVLMLKNAWQYKGVLLAAVLTVVTLSVLVKLGFWQLSRGFEKQQLENALLERNTSESQSLTDVMSSMNYKDLSEYTGLLVTADIEPIEGEIYLLDNQTLNGTVGYIAYQLVKTRGIPQQFLLIDLGFVAAGNQRDRLPDVEIMNLPNSVTGRLYYKSENPLSSQLGLEDTSPMRVQNLNLLELGEQKQVELFPMVLQPTDWVNWPQEFVWKPVTMKSEKHFGYAVQWFTMAFVLTGIMCTVSWRYFTRSKSTQYDESSPKQGRQ
ncbi:MULTISPECIES: SURF1 family protein [Vibrio]|uniref:SURF1 family protein n=1 Tax=Vibrio TaxID=662 RepID=UPI00142ED411|nr:MULTISPECIES: SURF1 family protein [Vibrio]